MLLELRTLSLPFGLISIFPWLPLLTLVRNICRVEYNCTPSVRLPNTHLCIMSHLLARKCADSASSSAVNQFSTHPAITPKSRLPLARSPTRLRGAVQAGDMSTRHDVKSVNVVTTTNGDLNNTSAARVSKRPKIDPAFAFRSLAIPITTDDDEVRQRYRPFLLNPAVETSDWVSRLELATTAKMADQDIERTGERLRVLVLFGSLRQRYVHSSPQQVLRGTWGKTASF